MKKIGIAILVGILLITVSACDKTEENIQKGQIQKKENTQKGQIHEHCVRSGTTSDNSPVEMNYEIYYTGERLNRIYSVEKVNSTSQETLDLYEESYRKIHSYYEDIEYYETEIIRTDESVTSIMDIDYDHIDIQQLEKLEGTENNIFENHIPKISKYKELAEKAGVKCEVAS